MAAVTQEMVMEALKEVYDPEIPVNVVDLGLIYGVEIEGDRVRVRMTMTTPGCPLYGIMTASAQQHIEEISGVESAEVELVWDPPWTPARMSELGRRALGWG